MRAPLASWLLASATLLAPVLGCPVQLSQAALATGAAALHTAAKLDGAVRTEALLKAGATPGVVTDSGATPLSLDCEDAKSEVVRLLLEANADPGLTLPDGETTLTMAARTGSVPIVDRLVVKRAAGVRASHSLASICISHLCK